MLENAELLNWAQNYEPTNETIELNKCSSIICQKTFISTQIARATQKLVDKERLFALERIAEFKRVIELRNNSKSQI